MSSPIFAIDPQEIILGLCGAKWNPTNDADVETMRDYWRDLAGVIPMFFGEAANADGREYITDPAYLLQFVADGMDKAYGMGGFQTNAWSKNGVIDPAGVYRSGYDDDPAMHPIVKLQTDDVECFIYDCAIVAIRHRQFNLDQAKIARFD